MRRADGAPGSDWPVTPAATPAAGPAGARAQRELRARAARAAHARRRRRLHAAGRRRGRARVHRLDDRPARRARASASRRPCTIAARRRCSGRRSRPAAASKTASGCSTSWRGTRRPRAHRVQAGAALRERHAAAGARRPRGGDVHQRPNGDLREVVRAIVTSPEFFAPDAYRAKVKTPFEFVVSALRATGADVRSADADRARARRSGHAALSVPAADRLRRDRRRLGLVRRARQPHELRAGDVGRPDARRRVCPSLGDAVRRRASASSAMPSAATSRRPRSRRWRKRNESRKRSRWPSARPSFNGSKHL